MSEPASPAHRPTHPGPWFLGTGLALGAGLLGAVWHLRGRIDELTASQQAAAATLQEVLGEVTRLRIEQSTGSKGPQALLEKLRTYAPLLASSRTTQPDYQNARKEMDAVLRAFATLGRDAWPAIQERLQQLPAKEFDEIKWLLEAGAHVDPAASAPLLKEILLGRRLPSPRLRWYAAEVLTRIDRPLAQATLRQILLTEFSRGIDPDHAGAYGEVPDPAAFATTGFNNFVMAYVRSQDPKLEDTLLMVMGRAEHDAITIQECIRVLAERKCLAAVKPIEKLYHNPPLRIENAIFLNTCLDALVQIQGKAAKPFLEQALAKPTHELVGQKIQYLLGRIESGEIGKAPVPAADEKPAQGK